jgi:Raf kinase inhibitor-like YbhB/YbcL family protein
MQKGLGIAALSALSLVLAVGAFSQDRGGKPGMPKGGPPMALTSPAFADGTDIPPKYTQAASDQVVSPTLEWTNAPVGTQTFVLLMHDPDVSRNRTTDDQTHWIVWNIPGTAKGLPENVRPQPTMPDGTVQGRNGGDTVGYRGPGAPATAPRHHYTFELFALDTKLDVGPETPRADVMKALNGHILGKAVYVGLFHRPN